MNDFIRYNGIFPPNKTLVKFRDGIGYLYLITFCNGRLKFGKSKEVISRIKNHQESYFNFTGGKIENVIILGPYKDMAKAENEFLSILRKNKIFPVASNEWFLGNREEIENLFPKIKSELFHLGILSNFQLTFLGIFNTVQDIFSLERNSLQSLHKNFVEKSGQIIDYHSFQSLLFEFDEFSGALQKLNFNLRKSIF